MRILFVEDNDPVRELICELLAEEGREAVACASAEEAEATFDRIRFDVVMTDVNLPSISGTDLARRLMKKRPDIWIVFCSGNRYDFAADKWGPRVRSITKPFDDTQLAQLLDGIASANTSS